MTFRTEKGLQESDQMLWSLSAGRPKLLEQKANAVSWTGGTAQQESVSSVSSRGRTRFKVYHQHQNKEIKVTPCFMKEALRE